MAGFELGEITSIRPIAERYGFCTAPDGGDGLSLRRPQIVGPGYVWANGAICELARGPAEVDLKSASCTETFYRAFGPRGGKRGKKIDGSFVALEQKLDDGRCRAEVAVDLEDRGFA